jgi:uncharacterized protein
MSDIRGRYSLSGKSPAFQLVISLLIIFIGGLFLFILSAIAGTVVFGVDISTLSENLGAGSGENNIEYYRYLMILQDVCLFIVPAIIILSIMKPVQKKELSNFKFPEIKDIFLTLILAFCIFPVTSFTGQLNAGMHLPHWLSGVEQWMTEKEDDANTLINLLISSGTVWILILNLFMIAVLPAIGEELIFRGVFQKIFTGMFRSGHFAIWITAFLFSSLHFQFFGFIPRFILGLIYGYLFFWSGTLWLPITAHFINNAWPTIAAYLHSAENTTNVQSMPVWKELLELSFPVIICLLILAYFRKKWIDRSISLTLPSDY